MQHDKSLALFFIRQAGNDKRLLGNTGQFVQFFLHLDVRHHLSADLAEAAQPVGDLQKTILVERRHVAGGVPAVAQDFRGFVGFTQVTLHHIRPAHQQQAGLPQRHGSPGPGIFGVHHADTNPGERMSDFTAFDADLMETGGAEVRGVHRHHRRAFRAAVTFHGPDAEMLLKGRGQPVRQFFRTRHHQAQAAEIRRRAAAQIDLQKRRGRQQESHRVIFHQRADSPGIQRIRMKRHARAEGGGQAKRTGETEGMEKGQDAQDAVVFAQTEHLLQLCNV